MEDRRTKHIYISYFIPIWTLIIQTNQVLRAKKIVYYQTKMKYLMQDYVVMEMLKCNKNQQNSRPRVLGSLVNKR